jgi:membrane protein DedA with SNARE-associated domain
MTFSGFTASRGRLSIVGAIVAGIAGSQTGSVALYAIARQLSEERLNEFLAKYGGWLGFSHENLERAEDFFRRHDRWAVLIGRLLPGVRAFIAVPAGIEKMPFWRFFLLNLLGTAFWVTVLTVLGSVLGDNYDKVDQYSSYITYGLLGALGLYVLYRLGVVTKDKVVTD